MSNRIEDLSEPFASHVAAFVGALREGGASVTILATLRPRSRVFLMEMASMIANGKLDPQAVYEREGVDIQWNHIDENGEYSSEKSIAAAQAMVDAYGINNLKIEPVLISQHNYGNAIDMSISWEGTLRLKGSTGIPTEVPTTPRTGMNTELGWIGKSFNVHKFNGVGVDELHWSDNGL